MLRFYLVLFLTLLVTSPLVSQYLADFFFPGQTSEWTHNGENWGASYNQKSLQLYEDASIFPHIEWPCPEGLRIEDVTFKSDDPTILLILLSNGDVYKAYRVDPELTLWEGPVKVGEGVGSLSGSVGKIAGDALYIASGSLVYVSRDTAETWEIDTVGLSGFFEDIAIDTNNFAWVATTDGVFTQHPDSNVWHKNQTFPVTFSRSILADRQGRIFVGASHVYRSTDDGASWDTMATSFTPVSLAGDAFGNIYATGSGNGYRSSGGTSPWEYITDPLVSYGSIFVRAISGDTLISAATNFGLFTSSDQGDTWSRDSVQLPNVRFFGLVQSGDYYLVSTELGVYRIMAGDTVITQVLPSTGFQGSITLATDSAGAIYSMVPVDSPNDNKARNFKSTNQGSTWFPDTAGLDQTDIVFRDEFTRVNPYFVDQQGNQYASTTFLGDPLALWVKRLGEPWSLDTLGLNLTGNETIRDVSTNNKKGIVYTLKRVSSSNYKLYQRALNDSIWQEIDVSSFGSTVLAISSDHEGNVIVHARSGEISIYDGSTWTPISLPAAIADPSFADLVSVSNSGVIWSTFRLTSTGVYRGLYFSDDGGASWTYAGLDSLSINFLSIIADTTYAITDIDGIYAFTTAGPLSKTEEGSTAIIFSFDLFQNYPNPFNPSTTISFNVHQRGRVTLKIYDVLGRDVLTLLDEDMHAGRHEVLFDASRLASGVYFYRIQASDFIASKRLVLIK